MKLFEVSLVSDTPEFDIPADDPATFVPYVPVGNMFSIGASHSSKGS